MLFETPRISEQAREALLRLIYLNTDTTYYFVYLYSLNGLSTQNSIMEPVRQGSALWQT
jgi:hypothetical protein